MMSFWTAVKLALGAWLGWILAPFIFVALVILVAIVVMLISVLTTRSPKHKDKKP